MMLKTKIAVENEIPITIIYNLKSSYVKRTFLRNYEENVLEGVI